MVHQCCCINNFFLIFAFSARVCFGVWCGKNVPVLKIVSGKKKPAIGNNADFAGRVPERDWQGQQQKDVYCGKMEETATQAEATITGIRVD